MIFLRSVAVIGSFTLASRILGFVRDVLIAAMLGTGAVADAFFVALRLPNLFRSLFAEGAFNSAFVPLFSQRLSAEGNAGAKDFAEEALSVLAFILVIFVGLMLLLMPYVILILAPGFVDEPERFNLAVRLSYLTFPYLLLISLATLFAGLLNALHHFALAAATQVIFNIVLIMAVLTGDRLAPTTAHALAWGTTLSGLLQLLWLMRAAHKLGFSLRLLRPRLTPAVRRMLKLVLPASIGAGAVQLGVVASQIMASLLPSGSVSYLFYADRLNQLPLGVIGIAVGTALLPAMSRQLANGAQDLAVNLQNRALELGLLLTVPAAAALIALPDMILRTLFERGAFDAAATAATAQALAAYAIGLPALVMIRALVTGFHARQDTTTPVRIGMSATLLGVLAGLALLKPLAHVGLALGVSIGAWVQLLLLMHGLRKRNYWQADARLKQRGWRIIAAALGMAVTLFICQILWIPKIGLNQVTQITILVGLIFLGMAIYSGLAFILGAASWADVRQLLSRRSNLS